MYCLNLCTLCPGVLSLTIVLSWQKHSLTRTGRHLERKSQLFIHSQSIFIYLFIPLTCLPDLSFIFISSHIVQTPLLHFSSPSYTLLPPYSLSIPKMICRNFFPVLIKNKQTNKQKHHHHQEKLFHPS